MVGYVILDDQSANVTYSGKWSPVASDDEETAYEGTATAPHAKGLSFELQFHGHKVAVRGIRTERSGGVKIAFAVDGGQSETVTFESAESGSLYDDDLWTSATLGDTDEMHVLTGQAIDASNEKIVFVDSFRVYQENLNQQTVSSWSPSTGNALPPWLEPTVSAPYMPPPSNSALHATDVLGSRVLSGTVFLIAVLVRLL